MNKNKKAFTLVELIVVITILAILGAIAFITLQSYNISARDSTRISDLSSMKISLELFHLGAGKYPETTNGYVITYSGSEVWTQGIFGENTKVNVEKLDKIPKDPLTQKEYTYSITKTRQEFELAGLMEGDEMVLNNNSLLNQTNAGEIIATAMVTGNYNGSLLKSETGTTCEVLSVPSIISSEGDTQTNLIEILEGKNLVYNGYSNLPSNYRGSKYKTNGLFEFETKKLVVYSDNLECKPLYDAENPSARINLVKNLKTAYSGTLIENTENIRGFVKLDVNNTEAVSLLSTTLVNNSLGGNLLISKTSSVQTENYLEPKVSLIKSGWTGLKTNPFDTKIQISGDLNDSRASSLGDLDGDGDLDIYVCNYGGQNKLWKNNGNFSFSNKDISTDTLNTYASTIGDFTGDGKNDIVIGNGSPTQIKLWKNNGNLTFIGSILPNGTEYIRDILKGDFDNDGDLDLYLIYDKDNKLLINNGSGVFSIRNVDLDVGYAMRGDVGDIDGDGDLDIVIANQRGSGFDDCINYLLINNGSGYFTYTRFTQELGDTDNAVFIDIDKDGDLDIFENNATQGTYALNGKRIFWINNGNLSFTKQLVTGLTQGETFFTDIDKDGLQDVIIRSGNSIYIYENNGNFSFSSRGNFNENWLQDIDLGDLNLDGNIDIYVVLATAYQNYILVNNGHGFDTLGNLNISFDIDMGDYDYIDNYDIDFQGGNLEYKDAGNITRTLSPGKYTISSSDFNSVKLIGINLATYSFKVNINFSDGVLPNKVISLNN